jgi:DNA helicase II / ATP-dependent DNA helicase PcrA
MELNEQQSRAVTFNGPQRNILVTAGAGCGKTRTIIGRIAHLIKQGTDPSRVLVMTFTNRAARELKLRLKNEVGETALTLQAGTFHAFCLKAMTQMPKSFEVSGLGIIDSEDQQSLMALIRKEYIKTHQVPAKELPKVEQLITYYSYSRNTCQNPYDYLVAQTDMPPQQIARCVDVFASYQKAKESRGFLDYDDLLERFSSILERKPALRKALCTLFDEVLVDEMQDTNPIQFSILRHFSDEGVRLFCVGDPAQSIYRFRGAEFKHVYGFEGLFGNSIVLPLSINYRSYQEILDFSNWLLGRSPYDYDHDLEAARGVCGYLPRVEDFEHQAEEADWIADYIEACSEREIALNDIMVLYRTAYEARSLEAQLIRREIPYRFIGGTVLTKSAHVRDVLSLLRLVRNDKDDLAWMRYLQLWPRIGERTAQRVIEALGDGISGSSTVLETLISILGLEHPAVATYNLVFKQYLKPIECLQAATDQLRPILSERYDNWNQRAKDLELLIRVAQNYTSTTEFIDDFTLEPLHDTQISNEYNDEAVTLITVHSAKGTEAGICIVAGASQSNYPHFRSLGDLEAEEEERRVLYVALTRAKNELIVTRSSFQRNAFWVESSPARGEPYFLQDLPKDLITHTLHGWSPRTPLGLGALKDDF